MKTTLKLLVVLVLVLATFSQHSTASAGGLYKFRGEGASAIFSSVDGSGCIWTEVYVNPSEGTSQSPPGKGNPSSWVYMFISQYDVCSDTQLLAAEGSTSLAASEFQVFGQLSSATFNATVNVFDYVSSTSFDVYIDLNWTGTGSVIRQSSHSHYNAPGCKFNTRFTGSYRPAVATGSVTDGVTNFTPEPSLGYDIYSAKNGEVYVGCN